MKLWPPFPQKVQHGGHVCPHYNNMEVERSNHDGVSPVDGGATAENQPPL
jgi:hypothetical protein